MPNQNSDIYKHVGKKLIEFEIKLDTIKLIVDADCRETEFADRLRRLLRSSVDKFLVHRLINQVIDSGIVSVTPSPYPATRIIKPIEEEQNLMLESQYGECELPWVDEI